MNRIEIKMDIPECHSIVTVIADKDLLQKNIISCNVYNNACDINISFTEECEYVLWEKIAEFAVFLASYVEFWRRIIFKYDEMANNNEITKEEALAMIVVIVKNML